MLSMITGLLSGLGGLFGGGGSEETEDYEEFTDSTTTASSQDLSPELLKSLESLFQTTLGSGQYEASSTAMSTRLQQLMDQANRPEFDVSSFAKGVTDQGVAAAGLDLESSINEMLGSAGVSEGGNSMSALLGNKMRNVTAANVSGISANATATGEQIRQAQQGQITEGIAGLSGQLQDAVIQMIQSTRGATQTGTSRTQEHTKGTSTTTGKKKGGAGGFFSGLGGFFNQMQDARTNA